MALICCLIMSGSVWGWDNNDATLQWQLADIPAFWKRPNLIYDKARETYAWYRCLVTLPSTWRDQAISLFVESVDDAREVYFNGQRIGALGTLPPEYRSGLGVSLRFSIPAKIVLFGQPNIIAIRTCQQESRLGFNVTAPVLFTSEHAIQLKGKWEVKAGDSTHWSRLSARTDVSPDAVFSRMELRTDVEAILKQINDEHGPLASAETLTRMSTPDDILVELAIGEPHVRQPVSIKWDERGRLWVMQYLQYPNPAGLKMVSRDKYLRTVYNKVPLPPPHHSVGQDKITIHEDTDRDGQYDVHKTFVDGLNLATSFAIGRDGVFVLNPPYLLFYPDEDHDDIPDSHPNVLLEGFGLEDSHSIANSLRWGPDGWLYACQGSTVSGKIRHYGSSAQSVDSMGQLIWRYHPERRQYEIFAEGGGNAFGLEIDSKGRLFSGHNGGDTRGFHYVQGGYYQKGFGKHGQLSNPYTFGYFPSMSHHKVQRFTHEFVIYEGGSLSRPYQRSLFGVAPLQSHVVHSTIAEEGSSFQTKDHGHLLSSMDIWCRPVDIKTGPDGAVYVADFYEQRIDHSSHYQGRIHRESGRIWRLRSVAGSSSVSFDLSGLTSLELVSVLKHKNKWFRQQALRVFGDHHDKSIVDHLRKMIRQSSGQFALELLWALNLSGGLDEQFAFESLAHENPYVRLWTVRLLCDDGQASERFASKLARLASLELNVQVRSQLACSARRLPVEHGLPIVKELLARDEDANDIHLPLLLWWALETHTHENPEKVLGLLEDAAVWDLPIFEQHIQARLMRRFAAVGTRHNLITCSRLLRLAPASHHRKSLLSGFEEAFQGRLMGALPRELTDAILRAGGGSLSLRVQQGDDRAISTALDIISDTDTDLEERIPLIRLLGGTKNPRARPVLLKLLDQSNREQIQMAVLESLRSFASAKIAERIVPLLSELTDNGRAAGSSLLASRPNWTLELLRAIQRKELDVQLIPMDAVRAMLLHQNDDIKSLVNEYWGNVEGSTSTEMLKEIARVTQLLDTGSGVPHSGKKLFHESCGKCHRLFDKGGRIGPDLTPMDRNDLRRLLVNVVNPSIEIREGYETYVVNADDGRTLIGFIADQDSHVVMLRGSLGESTTVPRDEIEQMKAIQRSIMPTGLLDPLDDQQIRDLFAYLRSSQPIP